MPFPCDPIKEENPDLSQKEVAAEMAKRGLEKECHLLCVVDDKCFPKKIITI